MNNLAQKNKVISSLAWKLLERSGTQGIQFMLQIILARLLLPKDYGIIALIIIFIGLSNVFIQTGFNTALIQKKDADESDFSSVFYLSLFVSVLLYAVLYILAPYIADFYYEPEIIKVLRVLAITLFMGVVNSIQISYLSREMAFKKLFYSSMVAIVISGTVGVFMAYVGYGAWALVWQQLVNQFSITLILWFTVKWRPKLIFSFSKIKSLFSFGWKLLVSNLINHLYMDLRSLIIGRIFNAEMLGFYNRGKQFPQLLVTNINGSIQSVMLPALSSQQENRIRVKSMVRRSISISSFILFPVMVSLAVTAEPMVRLVLTDKWLPAVPFLQIYCFTFVLWPIHTANLQAINALGRSDIFLKLEVIKKIIGLSILSVSVFYSVYAIAIGGMLSTIISSFINAYPNKKLLNYSFTEQIKDILPFFILSLISGIIAYFILYLNFNLLLTLLTQLLTIFSIYFIIAKLLHFEALDYIFSTVKSFYKRDKG